MRRAIKVCLKFATSRKRHKISLLVDAYQQAVNFYISKLWVDQGKLDKATLALLKDTRLSERYKSQALKQALEAVIATRRSAKALGRAASLPVFNGALTLDSKFVDVEDGKGSFDLVIKLSTLKRGSRIVIPTRKTAVLNKWLAVPGAKLLQGCSLSKSGLSLFVEIPDLPVRTEGVVLGIDVGMNKLLADSNGMFYGEDIKPILKKIRASKPKSKARYKAYRQRDNFINFHLNRLPWPSLRVLGIESLKDLKRGKKVNRGKRFRKASAPWTYPKVLERIGHKAQQNRVLLVAVPSAYTSQTCPACGECTKENRKGENFHCVRCRYSSDSDHVGAVNVLVRTLATLRSVESLRPQKAM